MRARAHISITRAKVQDGDLTRHVGIKLDDLQVFLVASGLGLPRAWGHALEATQRGFIEGMSAPSAAGRLQRVDAARLIAAAERIRGTLAQTAERLIERTPPDAAFAAFSIDGGDLHVVSAGACRVYLHRSGKPQRLTAREETEEGALFARVVQCSTPLEPGDLVMAGSLSAFSVKAVAQVVSVLQNDPRVEPQILASMLTEPAAQAGVGAAAIVLRIS